MVREGRYRSYEDRRRCECGDPNIPQIAYHDFYPLGVEDGTSHSTFVKCGPYS
jgi:hypothetical protein